ncbi:hypothetical protein B0T14DRAFT_495481 [Immersiella caudata]|uniref:Ankyrin n=1 Tax=Immersiella caudata TaxID=314043 RepID=A0AA40C3X8_9PEZI|nr:hypothetical protein B0T14DRAFT_495481 [Immersiella caudata]
MEHPLSLIERLAQELFDLILEVLPVDDTARLSRCSKWLQFRIQPALLGTEVRRSRAMKWACEKGLNTSIRTLLSYGASPTAIVLPDSLCHNSTYTVSTLQLTIKHGLIDTFNLLIELGAGINTGVRPGGASIRNFISDLYYHHPNRPIAVETFLRAGLASQLEQRHRDNMLTRAVNFRPRFDDPTLADWPSPEIVSMLLDSGADPNCVHRDGPRAEADSLSPLSATLLSGRWDLFDLLRARGAEIQGVRKTDHRIWHRRPVHVPIMAAVVAMLRSKGGISVEPVQKCLDAGADINVAVLSRSLNYAKADRGPCMTLITPIDLYLGAANFWANGRDVLQGLQYLLDNGASLDSVTEMPSIYADGMRRNSREELHLDTYRFVVRHPTVRILLDRCQVENLRQPQCLETVKLLIRHGGLGDQPGQVLARYDCNDEMGQELIPFWWDLLDAVMDIMPEKEDRTRLLYEYIVAKGEYPELGTPLAPEPDAFLPRRDQVAQRPNIGELTYATVRYLMLAGANINAALPAPLDRPQTCVFLLCDRYANKRQHFFPRDLPRLLPERIAFLTWLVEEAGVDPSIRATYWSRDGNVNCTAAELLCQEMSQLRDDERGPAEGLILVLGGEPVSQPDKVQHNRALRAVFSFF